MIIQKTIKGDKYLYYVHSFRDKKCFGGTGKVKKIWYFFGKILGDKNIDLFNIKYLEYYFYTNQIDCDKFIIEFNQFVKKHGIEVFPENYNQKIKDKKDWIENQINSLKYRIELYNFQILKLQEAVKNKDTDDITTAEWDVDWWYHKMILNGINEIMKRTPKNEKEIMRKKINKMVFQKIEKIL